MKCLLHRIIHLFTEGFKRGRRTNEIQGKISAVIASEGTSGTGGQVTVSRSLRVQVGMPKAA